MIRRVLVFLLVLSLLPVGLAAAETSFLSAMGKTYEEYPLDLSELHTAWFAKRPIKEIDDPGQAGEGILEEEYDDPQVGEQKYLNSGLQYMVAALFASGAGPVAEAVKTIDSEDDAMDNFAIKVFFRE